MDYFNIVIIIMQLVIYMKNLFYFKTNKIDKFIINITALNLLIGLLYFLTNMIFFQITFKFLRICYQILII